MKITKIINNKMRQNQKIELDFVKANLIAKINIKIRIKKLIKLNVSIKEKARNSLRISKNQKTLLSQNNIFNKNVKQFLRIKYRHNN